MIRDYFDDLLQELFISRVISSFTVLRREVGEDGGYIRMKCTLPNDDILEFAEYVEVHENGIRSETHSFHWQSADGELIKRWDNVRHHREVDTFPDHLHLPDGQVMNSPSMSLKKVLQEIEKALPIKDET